MKRAWRHARILAQSPLASRTAIATAFQLLRMALQLAFLVVLARALVPAQYGIFVGAAGLATTAGGLSGIGTGMLMVKQVASRRSLWDAAWSHALRMFLSTGAVLSLVFVLSVPGLLRVDITPADLACLAVSELVCLPIVYLGGFAFQAFDRIGWSTALPCIMSASRLIGAVAFVTLAPMPTLATYLVYHATASIVAAAIALLAVQLLLQPSRPAVGVPKGTHAEALRFCAGWFSNNAMVELDKSLAVRFGSPATAAAYALAYRLATLLSTPATSLGLSAQPRLFAAQGPQRRRLVIRIVGATAASSVLACVAMFLLAPLLPWIFGSGYVEAGHVAILLSALPLAFGLRWVLANLLVAEGYPGLRAALEVAGCIAMTLSAAVLIPRMGAAGMAATILIAEGAVAAMTATALLVLYRRRVTPPPSQAS